VESEVLASTLIVIWGLGSGAFALPGGAFEEVIKTGRHDPTGGIILGAQPRDPSVYLIRPEISLMLPKRTL
jgi:hypothetical protein